MACFGKHLVFALDSSQAVGGSHVVSVVFLTVARRGGSLICFYFHCNIVVWFAVTMTVMVT